MNDSTPSFGPFSFAVSSWTQRRVIWNLAKREVTGRYRGSLLGMSWTLLNPLFTLAVYTFVFGSIFNARWGASGRPVGNAEFALTLFIGLIVFQFFAECLIKSTQILIVNKTYAKKAIFPTEALPVAMTGAAAFHFAMSFTVFLVFSVIAFGSIKWTALFVPLVFLPLALVALGIVWILSVIGAVVRDLDQLISFVTTAMLFLSPVFYPLSAVPQGVRHIFMANPLTIIIEQMRAVAIAGEPPDGYALGMYALAGLASSWLGYSVFMKSKKAIAEIL
jgi:lipopolysaccharide transport system permease protein